MKIRVLALASAFAMLAIACGQKPGVHARAVQQGSGTGSPVAATSDLGTTDLGTTTTAPTDLGTTTTAPTDLGTGTGTTTGTGVGTPTGSTGTTGSGTTTGNTGGSKGKGKPKPGKTSAPAATGGGDKTGFTDKQIVYGINAPVTGAAPIRSDSFNTGKDLYWKSHKPLGREVIVKFADDQYNPSTAKSVCQQMAEQEPKAALLIGGAGTDQIKACADYAQTRGIPYLSAGVVQDSLAKHSNYFAVSMSYKQQAPLLAQYIKSKLGNPAPAQVLVIATATANFNDAVTAFQQAYGAVKVLRPSKTARGSTLGDDVCNKGPTSDYKVVFPLTSPSFFLELEAAAPCQVQYVGVGITMGVDVVAHLGCQSPAGSINNARFFSPFPAYSDKAPAEFKAAGGKDDIEMALWGISEILDQMLTKAGPNVSRQSFMSTVANGAFEGGVFPPLKYSPSNHFGGSQVHVLKAQCSGGAGHYVTEQTFASSF